MSTTALQYINSLDTPRNGGEQPSHGSKLKHTDMNTIRDSGDHAPLTVVVIHEPLNLTNGRPQLLRTTELKVHQVPRVVDVRQGERHVGVIATRRPSIRGD